MNKHYPEDVNQYDNEPRSPFYNSSSVDAFKDRVTEIVDEILSVEGFHEGSSHWTVGDVTERIYGTDNESSFNIILASVYQAKTEAEKTASLVFYRSILEQYAKPIATDIAERELAK